MKVTGRKKSSTAGSKKERVLYSLLDISQNEAETILRGLRSVDTGREGERIARLIESVMEDIQRPEYELLINEKEIERMKENFFS